MSLLIICLWILLFDLVIVFMIYLIFHKKIKEKSSRVNNEIKNFNEKFK